MKLPSLETKAKRLHVSPSWSPSWRDAIGLSKRPELAEALVTIRRYITQNLDLPERFYRKDRLSSPDRLLEEDAIMHLHLGDPGTRELVFLRQYPSDVVFLEISNHDHFANDPPGSVLRQLHESKLVHWEAEREVEIAALKASVRAGLPPRGQE